MGSLRDHRPDALIMKSSLLICKGVMNDEMQCVIAGENPGNVFSRRGFTSAIKVAV
jgi:hypothetical protein